MKHHKTNLQKFMKRVTIIGNIFFILWVLYNAIDKNIHGKLPEKISSSQLIEFKVLNKLYL